MRVIINRLIVLFIIALLLGTCSKKSDEITICGTRCSTATPWTLESLDQGLPCFASQDSCIKWVATHGGGNCVKCD